MRHLIYVGVAGFEPTTSCSQSRRDTGLRYTPNFFEVFRTLAILIQPSRFSAGRDTGWSLSRNRRDYTPNKG